MTMRRLLGGYAKNLTFTHKRNQMKRKISVVLLAVAMLFGLSAQAKFSIGPRVGLNVDKFHFDKSILDGENRCGITAGVQAEYMLPMIDLGLDLSVMYTHMKSEIQPEGTNMTVESVSRNFLEIPLNIKYKFGLPVVGSFMKPYVFTGPTAAVRLGSRDIFHGTLKEKSLQWGWNLGLGIEFIKHLQVGFNYTFGMNNIMEKQGFNVNDDVKAKNNYWTVSAAWLF